MARPALVTGRAGGASIAEALAVADYRVAATSHGSDETAAAFGQETGIAVFTSAFNVYG